MTGWLTSLRWCHPYYHLSLCPQEDVYSATTQHLVESVVSGYNATVFAYGPSGMARIRAFFLIPNLGPGAPESHGSLLPFPQGGNSRAMTGWS